MCIRDRYSYFSTAFIRPVLPSWIRSRKDSPRLRYFLAIETTRRRLPLESLRLASSYSAKCRRTWSTPRLKRGELHLVQRVGELLDLRRGLLVALERGDL